MDDFIQSEVFTDILTEWMLSKMWGICGMEFIPGDEVTMNPINKKHIKPDLGIIAFDQNGNTGYKYDDMDNIMVVGKRHDLGLYLKCAPYAIWKRGNMGDWAQFIEIFGMPVRIIKYDAYDEKTKIQLKQIVDESGSALAILIPKQADFEMVDGKTSNANGDLQEKFKKACDEDMSVIILGNTETTTSSKSSGYAQSSTHSKEQHEITKSDIKFIRNLLNSKKFKKILKSYGLPVTDKGKFVIEKQFDIAELANRTTVDEFVSSKVPISDDYYYETYGVPKPENYPELKKKMEDEKLQQQQQKIPKIVPDDQDDNGDDLPDAPQPKNLKASRSAWYKFRNALADFFDPAPLT
jgi:phage gp29-like protein